MSFYGPEQLAESMRTVRKNTLVIAEDIPDASYSYRSTTDSRSVSELLLHIGAVWQITYQIQEIERCISIADFDFRSFFQKPAINEQRSASKDKIISFLRSEGERLSKWVEELRESFLTESVQMPRNSHPATKNRFEILGAKEHEMHHRAQLMVVQRLLGIVPHLSRNRQASAAETARTTT